jgi:hypothetical protein
LPEFVTSFSENFQNLDNWVVNSTKTGSANGYPGGPGQFGTDEIETVGDDPTNLIADGRLRITPTRVGDRWYSARIETARVFKPAAGSVMRVEARIQLPNVHGPEAAGYWPAFWMMGSTQRDMRWTWPACGEFDITESVNGVNRNWATVHGGPASLWGGPFGEPSGYSNGGVAPSSGDIWGEFHLYRFEWDRTGSTDELRWYVDDVQVHTAQPAVISAGDWATMSNHPGYFIILNVAMGGQFPAALGGGPYATTRPGAPMVVEYVRVSYAGSEAPETAQGNDGRGGTVTPPVDPPTDPPVDPGPTDPPIDPPITDGAPSNLHIAGSSINSVTLGWDGGAGDYAILRSGVQIGATKTGGTEWNNWVDRGLAQYVPYLYSVRGAGVTTPQITVTLPIEDVPPVDPPVDPPVGTDRHYRIDLTIPTTGEPTVTITTI